MTRKERIQKAFAYLLGTEQIKSKQQVADIMGVTRSSVSKAYNGYDSYLTNDFLKKFCLAFPGTFNLSWLLDDEGDMLQGSRKPQEEVKSKEVDNSSNEIINRLVDELSKQLSKKDKQIEDLSGTIKNLTNEIAELKEDIKHLHGSMPNADICAPVLNNKKN